MRKIAIFTVAAFAAAEITAQGFASRGARANAAQGSAARLAARSSKVDIVHMPKPDVALIPAPSFAANLAGGLQPPISKRPRRWALFELKYRTSADWQDELTFTWHILVKADASELKKSAAVARARGDEAPSVTPYSYYTATVRYVNVPRGEHMACTGLTPSTVEHYGRPVCISVVVTDKDGKELAMKTEDSVGVSNMAQDGRWWDSEKVMNSDRPNLKVARRNGLLERSKTPFALVNSSDYEDVQ